MADLSYLTELHPGRFDIRPDDATMKAVLTHHPRRFRQAKLHRGSGGHAAGKSR